MTEHPDDVTYVSVVSRETVCLALTIAALNDIEVDCGGVLNAHITATVEVIVWTTLGPEFVADSGKRALNIRALYGLKSAGADFCAHLGHKNKLQRNSVHTKHEQSMPSFRSQHRI